MDDFDTIPVRLPSGTKAIVQLPRPFTLEDGIHLMEFLSSYIEEKTEQKPEAPQRDSSGLLHSSFHIARHPHQCQGCGKPIERGERYYRAAAPGRPKSYTFPFHESCYLKVAPSTQEGAKHEN